MVFQPKFSLCLSYASSLSITFRNSTCQPPRHRPHFNRVLSFPYLCNCRRLEGWCRNVRLLRFCVARIQREHVVQVLRGWPSFFVRSQRRSFCPRLSFRFVCPLTQPSSFSRAAAVNFTVWSADGARLLTCDSSGGCGIWKISGGKLELCSKFSMASGVSYSCYAGLGVSLEHRYAVGCDNGRFSASCFSLSQPWILIPVHLPVCICLTTPARRTTRSL
jgi:hypothetical protein